jgi:halocyanin-like protein
VWGAPHVVDGTVYVGANDNHVYALVAGTGEQQWRYDTGRYAWGSPTVVDGTLYGGSRSHRVFALDAATGEEEWTYRAEGPVGSAPTVVDGRVHFASYLDVNMTTLDAETGEHMWHKEFSSELCAPPAYHDGTLYTGFVDQPLFAFDAATGEEEWRFEPGRGFGIKNPPTVWNGTVYQAVWNHLYAVDADTGELQWDYADAMPRRNGPTVAGGTLFVGSSRETYLLALDPETGEERWRFEVYGNVRSGPTVVDGVVFFGADDGSVHAVYAGVEGSSADSRGEQGVMGHHHGWVGEPEPDLEMVPDDEPYERADASFELPYGDWFEDVPNYEGTVDRREQGRVTVEVGAGEEGIAFDPPAVLVDPGSKVIFEWTGDGGNHNVVEENGVWESELSDEAGHTFPVDWSTLGRANLSEHGVYRYFCSPHRELGMRGAVVMGDVEAVVDDLLHHEIRDVELSSAEARVGESVRVAVTVDITWSGTRRETFDVALTVDGEVVESVSVPGDSDSPVTETFEQSFEEPGEYDLGVNGERAGTVTVVAATGTSTKGSEGSTDDATRDADATGDGPTETGAPGFGVLGGLAGLGGLGYLLGRHGDDEE